MENSKRVSVRMKAKAVVDTLLLRGMAPVSWLPGTWIFALLFQSFLFFLSFVSFILRARSIFICISLVVRPSEEVAGRKSGGHG